jgi:hypothetical protein
MRGRRCRRWLRVQVGPLRLDGAGRLDALGDRGMVAHFVDRHLGETILPLQGADAGAAAIGGTMQAVPSIWAYGTCRPPLQTFTRDSMRGSGTSQMSATVAKIASAIHGRRKASGMAAT